ncbi:MAG TPA: fluoride efflux transporter CrcB [Methylomirabilota bacterium]|jgi:CrcB protein|nr:fluoride efflux transporter CrcB [Methylomirabilota bacterium]
MLGRVLLVALGGAFGSALRYVVALLAVAWLGPAFPWGTLAVNLAGSFAIGLVQQLAVESLVLSESTRLLISTGVLGGLTTYSSFSYESVRLIETGAWLPAWLNVLVTTVACLTLCFLGLTTGRILLAPR